MGKVVRWVVEGLFALVFVLVFAVMSASCSCSEETEPQKAAPVRTIVACKARGTQGQAAPRLEPAQKTIVPGAIPGQFSITSTGEATYSVRLTSVPGRPPLEPDLGFAYSSAGGDGILGMGFSLTGAGSSITRCPQNMAQDGEIRAIRFDAEDRLCLDGRRMVPVADAPGTIEYRLIPDAFIKVVGHFPADAKEKTANNALFFEAFMPSGLVIEYGKGDAGKVVAKGGVPRAFLATVARDQRGSFMEYSHCFAEADGYTAEVALTEIRYTGFNGATTIEPTRAVRFVYSPKATEDARLYFAEGMALQSSLKLDEVQMFGPGDSLVRRYVMTYSASHTTRRTLLQQIEECGADGACKPPTRFQYKSNELGFKRIKTTIPAPTSKLASPMLMDLNRDGLDDYVAPDTNPALSTPESPITEWFLSYNQGPAADPPYFGGRSSAFTQTWDTVQSPKEKGDPTSIQPEVATALDHNQDGRADLWLHDVYGSRLKDVVLLAAPNHTLSLIETEVAKPFPLSAPPPPPTMITHGASIHFADIDGDGQPDRIQCVDHSDASADFPALPHWRAQLWRPEGAGKPAGFEPEGEEIVRLVGVPCAAEVYPADIDADGRIDLVIPEFADFDGTGFIAGAKYMAFSRRTDGSWEAFDTKLPLAQTRIDRRVVFVDVNADSLPDCIQSGFSDNRLKTFMNTGRTFDEVPTDSLYWDNFGTQDYHFRSAVALDADGDGRQDLLMPIAGGVWPNVSSSFPKWYILRATGALSGPTFEPIDPKIPLEAQIGDVITIADPRAPRVGDLNGDGAPDVVTFLGGVLNIFEHQAPDQDLLIAVSDGMAEVEPDQPGFVPSVAISYGHLIDPWETNEEAPDDPALESYLYVSRASPANDCEYPRRCAVGPRRVVSGYAFRDGLGGQRSYGLRYRDGRYDRLGNGFVGFAKRITTDLDTGAGSIDFFDNRTLVEQNGMRLYPFAGQVMHRWSFAPGLPGQLIPSQVELSFADTTPTLVPTEGGKSYFTLATKQRSRRIQGTYPSAQAPAESLEEYVAKVEASGGGVVLSDTTSTVTDFDEFGNMLEFDAVTAGVDLTHHVKRTFKNDEDRWILGQLQTQKECSSASGLSRCRLLTRTTTDFGEVHTASLSSDEGIPDTKLDLVYERNEVGGVTSVTADDAFGHHRVSSTVFDAEGIYPTAQVNAAEHTTLVEYDARFGTLAKETDPNQLVTEWHFDSLGQTALEIRPDGSQTTLLRSRNQDHGLWRVMIRTITTGGADDLTVLDSLGRPIRRYSHGPDPADDTSAPLMLMQVLHYDRLSGRVARRSVPTSEGTPEEKLFFDEFTYDAIGREVRHKTPWNAVTETLFEGFVVKRWDPLLHVTTTEVDALGRPKVITDAANGLTQYTHGPFNTLYTVTDPGGSLTRVTPDAFGRARTIEDPDRGTTLQIHNGFSELESSTDAQGRVVKFGRDPLGRPVSRTDTHGLEVLETTWDWDTATHGIGALHSVTSPDAVKTYSYTPRGRLEGFTLGVTGKSDVFKVAFSYDLVGRPASIAYPTPQGMAPFAVDHEYDDYGHLLAVRDAATKKPYWQLTAVDDAGRFRTEAFGNGVTTERSYFSDKQALQSILTLGKGGAPTIQKQSFEWDPKLNLKARTDALQPQFKTERFRHDELDRVTCAYFSVNENPLAPCAQSYAYAPNGNIAFKSDVGAFTYGDPAHPHAVTAAGGSGYSYSPVGNQVTRPGGVIVEYTPFDLPRSFTQGADVTTFGYDGEEARIRKTTPTAETIYVGDLYERVTDLASAAVEHRYSIHSPERVIAVVTRGGASPGPLYLHVDHLGSVNALTDGNGVQKESRSYDSFGGRRNPIWGQPPPASFTHKTTKGYTGHEEDDEFGLINARGRILDPKLGRFLTIDPLISNIFSGQAWNPYSYVSNRPLSLIDPTGFQECGANVCDPAAPSYPVPTSINVIRIGALPVAVVENITVVGNPSSQVMSVQAEAADVGVCVAPTDVSTTGTSPVLTSSTPPPEAMGTTTLVLSGIGKGVGGLALGVGKFVLIGGPTLGVGSTYMIAKAIYDGYKKDGVLGAANVVNPAFPVFQATVNAADAIDRNDPEAAAEAGTQAVLLGAITLAGVAESGAAANAAARARAALAESGAAEAATAPRAYSVAYETTIPKRGIGSYPSHFINANRRLLQEMAKDPDLAAAMRLLNPELETSILTPSGKVLGVSPKGWTWHHVPGRPGVMQLVPRVQHEAGSGSAFQSLIHPNGSGGFKEWGSLF